MIYFDNAATTKPSILAIQKASIYNTDMFYNPSALYEKGIECSKAIRECRDYILFTLKASNNYQLIFTSCGSESDNTAIFCAKKKGVFVTTKGEHSAIYKSFVELKNRGIDTFFADINKDGSVNTDCLFDYIKNNKVDFVSIVHVNNETGAINDINYISKELKKINPNIIFHSDGVQAFGKLPYIISDSVDLYSISAHKINALKGLGCLIKKKDISLSPLIFGGGQENGLRSGTENVFGIKVFEYATREHFSLLQENFYKVNKIKEYVKENINKEIFEIISSNNSSPYILTISAKGLRGEILMHLLESDGIIVGNGSACSSKNRYSRVIKECGYSNDILDGVIRISFSIDNTIEEADKLIQSLNKHALSLKGVMHR